ncbi:unnamed protein product [Caenorhabditis nigoni]
MRYIFYYCRIALEVVRKHLLSCISRNKNTPEEVVREDSSTMFSETLEALETTKDDDKQDKRDSVQDEQVDEMIANYAKDLEQMSISGRDPPIAASTESHPNLAWTNNIPAEHGRQVDVEDSSVLLHGSQNQLLNIPMESTPAQESGTEPADNENWSDEYSDNGKEIEEQRRAHELELETKRRQRIDKNNQAKEERRLLLEEKRRLFLEELRNTGSTSQ